MYETRILNGYTVIYKPEHHAAMHGSGYNGFVYEHVYEAELMLGRPLNNDEVVHHLDFDRSNNTWSNLLVLSRSMHSKLHKWLNKCDIVSKDLNEKLKNSEKAEVNKKCGYCCRTLKTGKEKFCSFKCACLARSKKPTKDTLIKMLTDNKNNLSKVGRILNVSSSAVRKWVKAYMLTRSE